jgi:hypothetical protein
MNDAAAELRRLQRLDRHTRRRATRSAWLLPILFAVLVPVQVALAIDDFRLAIAFAVSAAVLAMWGGYLMSRSAGNHYGTGEPPAVLWLIIMSIVAAAVAVPLLGAAAGWTLLATCGGVLAVGVGFGVINFTVARPPARRDQLLLAVPVLAIIGTSLGSYAAGQQLGQPVAVVLGLLTQGWIWRWIVTR